MPLTRISPETIGCTPQSSRASDERPEPSSPATPTTSPRCRTRSTSLGFASPDKPRASSSASPTSVVPTRDVGEAARTPADDGGDHAVEGEVGERRRDDVLSIPQHGGAVGDAEDLVHAMRHVDHRDAPPAELAHVVEQALDLVRRQRRGRFVEHQHLAGLGCRLDDLGQLAMAGGDVGDAPRRVDVDPHGGEQPPAFRDGGPIVDQGAALDLAVEEDVLGDGERRHQAHLLERHGDTGGAGGLGREGRERGSADRDRAGGRRLHAAQDLQDGGLAGAVLAEQRVNLAGPDREADAVERPHAAEMLRHVGHADGIGEDCRGHRDISHDESLAIPPPPQERRDRLGVTCSS